jgi:hypothetical protein
MAETSFQRACGLAEQKHQYRHRRAVLAPRPTPQSTIEAVLYCVRERGLKTLQEPANLERLRRCDAAAKRQINERIARMVAKEPAYA